MSGIDSCDWRFVSDSEIPPGPWKRGEGRIFTPIRFENSSDASQWLTLYANRKGGLQTPRRIERFCVYQVSLATTGNL